MGGDTARQGEEAEVADDRDATLEQARLRDGQRAMLERTHDPARVLALSDGVFAIIITLPACTGSPIVTCSR
jgi:hypothetical protein